MRLRLAGSLIALALVVAIALAGCGGDAGEQSTSATTSTEQQVTTTQKQPQRQKRSAEKSKQSSGQSTTAGAPVPGAKAVAPGVPVTKGGDNSVQVFGAEGETGQRAQATADLKAYLNARLAREWSRACAATSREFKQQLAKLISGARARGAAKKPKGCVATLRLFFTKAPNAALRAAAQVNELLSFRVKGGYAYLIFKGAGGAVMFIAMANDDGAWKVNVAEPEEFPTGSR